MSDAVLDGTHEQFRGKITVSQHAMDEAVRDFRVNHKLADEWIRSNLRKARFIAVAVGEKGNTVRLFGFQRIAFVLDKSENHVITVYPRHHATSILKQKVEMVVFRELQKMEKLESATERKHRLLKAEMNVERAQLLLKLERVRSEDLRLAYQARVRAIDESIQQLDEDFMKIRKDKAAIAKSIIAYI